MRKLALIAAAALTVGSFGVGAAMAQGTDDAFAKADANHDMSVSWDEAVAVYPTLTQELFNQADANSDGKLDNGEFTALVGLSAGLPTGSSSSSAM